LVPKVIVMLVPVLVDDVVAVDGEVEVALVGAVVVVVVGVVAVVVGVVDDGVVVVLVAAVDGLLGTGPTGWVVEPEPPNNTKTISTSSSTRRTPNNTNAQGDRYHGRGGFSGGPGGCCPYGA
jgi:hypothetical protein